MQAILIYLLKVIICSAILFLYYHIALHNKRFHYYNRFYLLMSVALSLLLPFLNITLWQFDSSNRQVIQLMNVVAVNTTEVSTNRKTYMLSWNCFTVIGICVVHIIYVNSLSNWHYINYIITGAYTLLKVGEDSFYQYGLATGTFLIFQQLILEEYT